MDKSRDTQNNKNQSRDEIEATLRKLIEQNEALKKRNNDLHREISVSGKKRKAPEIIKDRKPESATAVYQNKKNMAPVKEIKKTVEKKPEIEKTQIVSPVKEPINTEKRPNPLRDETQVVKMAISERPVKKKRPGQPTKQENKKPVKRTERKIIKGIIIAIATVAVISLICGLFAKKPDMKIFGGRFYTVENENMSPEIKPEDIVFVKSTPVSELKEGDTILSNRKDRSFAAYDSVMRKNGKEVINVHDGENCYEIAEKDYIGKAVMKLRLGRIANYAAVHTYNYYAFLISSTLICIGLLFLIPGMGEGKKRKNKNKAKIIRK